MLDWNTLIVAILGNGALITLILKIFDVIGKKKCKKDDMQEARDNILICLSASDLIRVMQEDIKNKETDIHTRKHCDKLYKAYKALGGNDIIDSLYSKYIKLDIKPED